MTTESDSNLKLPVSEERLSAGLIFAEGQELTHQNKEALWELFEAIGNTWLNTLYNSNNQRSSWYEMIKAKTENAPNYTGEYVNAIYVMEELYRVYGKRKAFEKLFFDSGVDNNAPPTTRLAHCKIYVVNEFIRMQVMAGGFKSWGKVSDEPMSKEEYRATRGRNYHGYVGGSRYNRTAKVREYKPDTKS